MITHKHWVNAEEPLSLVRQCMLSGISRSVFYTQRDSTTINQEECILLNEIDAEYTRHPFYGSRKMVVYLRIKGHNINRKRVQRLMNILGLAGMAPGPATSRKHPQHPVYPYLLRGLAITKPNQVWSTDVTYIRLASGFVYLVAIIDWYSRKVLAWQVSNTLDGSFCIECLETALELYGAPEIFNSDQGCQFTAIAFTDVLKLHKIQISMDGRGRALDNIFVERLWRSLKYEDVYLKCYTQVPELISGMSEYFDFYNLERPHQALGYSTPEMVYTAGFGGGALIVDKFTKIQQCLEIESGQRRAAA
jgi:putative transposase